MSGHGQFCPVAVASEVFAHRWTPLIVRELAHGPAAFNDLHRGMPRISRTLLAQRLRTLTGAGVVAVDRDDTHRQCYRLTDAGAELIPVVHALGTWGQRWTARFDQANLDPDLLMWNVRRRLDFARWPATRTVARFDFAPLPPRWRKRRSYWLVVEPPDVTLCLQDPGDELDLQVDAGIEAFARVWLGDLAMAQALRDGAIRVAGRASLVRAFPHAFLLSRFANVPRT